MPYRKNLKQYDDLNLNDLARHDAVHKFIINAGFEQFRIEAIPGDASKREYYRVHTLNDTYILMDTSSDFESLQPFMNMDNLLLTHGIRAPIIISSDIQQGLLLLEDFGDNSFTKYLKQSPEQELTLYNSAIDVLVATYKIGSDLKLPKQNKFLLNKGIETFLDWYVKNKIPAVIFNQVSSDLYQIFDKLYPRLPALKEVLVHRDYMADNLFWLEKGDGASRIGVIDFQDAILGSPAYDMVSLLEDARRDVDSDVVIAAKKRFLEKLPDLDKSAFDDAYAILSAQRNLRIIGVFTRLNVRDNKPKYLGYLPRVWGYVMETLEHPAMFELKHWFLKYDLFEKQ
jgi:aminoglycoside/choline kinase family phosphotransferase